MAEDNSSRDRARSGWADGSAATGTSGAPVAARSETQQAQQLLGDLVRETLVERRRARRWSIFFRLLTFSVLALLLYRGFTAGSGITEYASGPHTAVIELNGIIADGEPASAVPVIQSLEDALEDPLTRGVILSINSPGGSPVQSGILFDSIRALRDAYPDIPVHAVLGDVAASGAYYVAAAADRIYADKASIVGSIGVRMDSFGATEAIDRLGIERRLLTAGQYKGLLDPFLPEDERVVSHLQGMLDQIHQQFIEAVKTGRGDRLADDDTLFTGLVWSGEAALDNGLVDELGNVRSVARDVIGEGHLVNFTRQQDLLTRMADRIGAAVSASLGLWSVGRLS